MHSMKLQLSLCTSTRECNPGKGLFFLCQVVFLQHTQKQKELLIKREISKESDDVRVLDIYKRKKVYCQFMI